MTDALHAFEKAGLGPAPFRCVGLYSIPSPTLAEHNPTAYAAALADMPRGLHCGSCNFCGTAIMHNFIIESHDERRFVVGSDCVARTGDAGLLKATRRVRLETIRAKRADGRRMKADERKELWALERKARGDDFRVQYAALIERAAPEIARGGFVADVIERHLSGCFVSDKAIAAVVKVLDAIDERAARVARSQHVGKEKERRTFVVTVVGRASYERQSFQPSWSGNNTETVWIVTMSDADGNTIVSKSPNWRAEKGDKLTIKATIKGHDEYKGEKQTIVQRVKEIAK